MNQIDLNLASELRISSRQVFAGLVFFGLTLIFASDFLAVSPDPFKAARLGLLISVLSLVGWLLSKWRLEVARWFIIMTLVVFVFGGINWLETPVFLTLVVMPVMVAAILDGFLAAIITAVVESLLLGLLPPAIDLGSTLIIFLAIWATVGMILAVYHPLYELTHWSWDHYRQAQDLLEEARDRKVELHQALDDLAHAYRELTLLNERVTAMRLVAEEAQAAKTTFVAKVSHEFRTPLNMIIGLTDVLMDTPEVYGETLSPVLLEDLRIVHRNCEHLSKMVNDILDLSQTEMGRLTLRREWVDLTEDVEAALTIVQPLLEKKRLAWQIDIPPDLPQVYCDQTRIRQVILNLVSNAARFTNQGCITVSICQREQYLIVNVADTGPGILPEDAQKIFEPFYQAGSNPWRDQKGSGLGLSISKQFVELHGGQMWLESEPGRGSIFSFQLPISLPTSPPASPARWISRDWIWHERTAEAKLPLLPHKQRIIVCDDTGELDDSLAARADEVEVIILNSLEQAIHEAQAVPAHAVVINTNSHPNLESIIDQAKIALPDTPIITGAFPSRTKDAFAAGAANYLVKPVTRFDLENALKAIDRPIQRILITDDDLDFQQLLRRMLLIYDPSLEIIAAANGEQALSQLRAHSPDLLLIDIAMLGLDGWQTLEQKKQDMSIKDIPVIIVSAQDPAGQPITTPSLRAMMGPGISADKFLQCSLELSALLLESNREFDPAPG
jgi:signal transduction histidine kinase/CheY-like chemotaxis protein